MRNLKFLSNLITLQSLTFQIPRNLYIGANFTDHKSLKMRSTKTKCLKADFLMGFEVIGGRNS